MKFTLEVQKIMASHNYLIAIRDNFENLMSKSVLKLANRRIQSEQINTSVKNRIFWIVVECVQNICQTEQKEKDSLLLLHKVNDGFEVIAGSQIDNMQKERYDKLLFELGSLNLQGVKELWKEALHDKSELDKIKKEKLAIIDVHLLAQGHVKYHFEENENGSSFFTVQIKISNPAA